jgi:hypothetical protein
MIAVVRTVLLVGTPPMSRRCADQGVEARTTGPGQPQHGRPTNSDGRSAHAGHEPDTAAVTRTCGCLDLFPEIASLIGWDRQSSRPDRYD